MTEKETAMKDINERLLDWLRSGDTGMSSKALAMFFSGRKSDGSHPHDNGDFGRCSRMLAIFPEWKARISEAACLSSSWAALVPIWDELEALYKQNEGSPYMYDFMRGKLREAEKDDGWVRFGKNASFRVEK